MNKLDNFFINNFLRNFLSIINNDSELVTIKDNFPSTLINSNKTRYSLQEWSDEDATNFTAAVMEALTRSERLNAIRDEIYSTENARKFIEENFLPGLIQQVSASSPFDGMSKIVHQTQLDRSIHSSGDNWARIFASVASVTVASAVVLTAVLGSKM